MADYNDIKVQLDAAAESLSKGNVNIDNEGRKSLIAACDKLKATLESPLDVAFRLVFSTHQPAAVRVAMELGVFNAMAMAKEPTSNLDYLATKTGADPLLIGEAMKSDPMMLELVLNCVPARIMRILSAMRIFTEMGENAWSSTPAAKAFVDGSPLGHALLHFHDVHGSVLVKLPEYFRQNGFSNPSNASAGPFQYAFGTDLHHFDWLKQNPRQLMAFNSLMTAQRRDKGEDWFNYFPVEERLASNRTADKESPLLVDVGGGLGTDLTAFRTKYPHIDGRLILQDLPEVIAGAKDLGARIEPMGHDFFTPQTVVGAQAYYLRTILHDWPDKEAKLILQNTLQAMAPDSILLLNEYVLPDSGVPLFPGQLDLSMMAIFSSLERTKLQWEDLLNSAGFEVLKIWAPQVMDVGHASLIEARPKHTS